MLTDLNLIGGNHVRTKFRTDFVCSNSIEIAQSNVSDGSFIAELPESFQCIYVALVIIVLPVELPVVKRVRIKEHKPSVTTSHNCHIVKTYLEKVNFLRSHTIHAFLNRGPDDPQCGINSSKNTPFGSANDDV